MPVYVVIQHVLNVKPLTFTSIIYGLNGRIIDRCLQERVMLAFRLYASLSAPNAVRRQRNAHTFECRPLGSEVTSYVRFATHHLAQMRNPTMMHLNMRRLGRGCRANSNAVPRVA
jgi:hypothetical protein